MYASITEILLTYSHGQMSLEGAEQAIRRLLLHHPLQALRHGTRALCVPEHEELYELVRIPFNR